MNDLKVGQVQALASPRVIADLKRSEKGVEVRGETHNWPDLRGLATLAQPSGHVSLHGGAGRPGQLVQEAAGEPSPSAIDVVHHLSVVGLLNEEGDRVGPRAQLPRKPNGGGVDSFRPKVDVHETGRHGQEGRCRGDVRATLQHAAYDRIGELARDPRVRVIGESGLDYYRTGPEGREVQHEAFRWHIALAKELGKPLQIHDRDSHDDILAVLDDAGAPEQVVMHCFSGDAAFAQACLERGFYLSFAGPITFKNNHALRDALAVTPLERVLLETDAPYLTPHPWRGAVNSPYLLALTARSAAAVLGIAVAHLCEAVGATAEELYGPW